MHFKSSHAPFLTCVNRPQDQHFRIQDLNILGQQSFEIVDLMTVGLIV